MQEALAIVGSGEWAIVADWQSRIAEWNPPIANHPSTTIAHSADPAIAHVLPVKAFF
ncbi:MAG: hypothetical protein IT178_16680 [Acidobacteria bacterium]|nr:hypothetical protein [Acidobacteriota bacterium]